MYYQLPNGKTIYMTLDEFFNLSKEEEQFLMMYGYGEDITNPFHASVINNTRTRIEKELENDPEDDPLDTDIDVSSDIDLSDETSFLDCDVE